MATTTGKRQAQGTNLLAWRENRKLRSRVDYGDIDSATLQRCLRQVTANGGAIMFGITADGGAFSVVVLHKDEKLKEYPNSAEAMEGFLQDLGDSFQDTGDM